MIKKNKFFKICSVHYGGGGHILSLPTSHGSEQCKSVGDFLLSNNNNKEGKR